MESTSRDDLLTVVETSDRLRKPVNTLYAWRHRGYGPPAIKVGRTLLYRRGDVDDWLATLVRTVGA